VGLQPCNFHLKLFRVSFSSSWDVRSSHPKVAQANYTHALWLLRTCCCGLGYLVKGWLPGWLPRRKRKALSDSESASELDLSGSFEGIRTPNLLIRSLSDSVSGAIRERHRVTDGDRYRRRCGKGDRPGVTDADRCCPLRTEPMFSLVFSYARLLLRLSHRDLRCRFASA
jgi:hypothetical protein